LRIKLQDQPFKILVALLEKPGEMASREELRELVWGNDTFVDYQHGLNAAVNRLRDALGDSAESPRYIETVARRGYRFIGEVDVPAEPAPVTAKLADAGPAPSRKLLWAGLALAVAAVGLAGVGLWVMRERGDAGAARLSQISALIGSETMPSMSPDGEQLAYVWNGENERNADIYVRLTGSETALRLTSDPGPDLLPSWSPDGHQIAFVRITTEGKTGVYAVSPLGGPERKLLELPGVDHRPAGPETRIVGDLLYPMMHRPSWSADGKFLAVSRYSEPPEPGDGAVLLIPVDGGEARTMMAPPAKSWYKFPTISPDGRRLAVALCTGLTSGPTKCRLQVVSLSKDLAPVGEPLIILSDCKAIRGLTWMPDGDSLIVSGFSLPRFYLWRVSAREKSEPQRIELASHDALWPSVSRDGQRLVYARSILQADLWKWELGKKPAPFLSSTARDTFPRLSADGAHIAFQSARGGEMDIWAARTDGTGLVQITKKHGTSNGAAGWSPDGRWISFDSNSNDGKLDVWIVEAGGGQPRQLTHGPGGSGIPSWSRDGKRIYFKSDRTGRPEIWRIPIEGGDAEQITRKGGFVGFESTDGKTLYYTKNDTGSDGLYAQPLARGDEKHVVSGVVVRWCFFVVREGIYYITPRDPEWCEIRFYDFANGQTRVIGDVERPVAFGMSVSPDQRTFVYSRPVTGSDLMLIDHFR
jgi:Tol biopolymer transport system component/DNA-binding winged helix-turn-helix (wHTH) protein